MTEPADLGILGGGQLGLMLAQAASELQLSVVISDPNPSAPVKQMAGFVPASDWDDAWAQMSARASAVTWEREDLDGSQWTGAEDKLVPSPAVLANVQDRLGQKTLFDRLDLATAKWLAPVDDQDADAVIEQLGLPVMVKARKGGFDGRGQVIARTKEALQHALVTYRETGAVVEQLINFDDEFAVLVTRGADGAVVHYPTVRTCQIDGQLAWALAPHPQVSASLEQWAQQAAASLAEAMQHVGTLAVECFRSGDQAVINEIAPRVHNSGHWTIEGCAASQFANHVRAVCQLPLVQPKPTGVSLLVNCLGAMPTDRSPFATVHNYGKESRPRRKVGHVTIVGDSWQDLAERMAQMPSSLLPADLKPAQLAAWQQVG